MVELAPVMRDDNIKNPYVILIENPAGIIEKALIVEAGWVA